MTGTLYLSGSGPAHDEKDLWRPMLAGDPRILYWPFALTASMLAGAHDWLSESLARFDFAGTFTMWTTLSGHEHTELQDFDVLLVGGGNTFKLLHEMQTYGFIEPTRQFVRRGGTYYGGSAGAVVACDDISIADGHDPNEIGLTDLRALGLINGLAILPHYLPADKNVAQEWALQHRTRLVGLPERTGLIARGPRFWLPDTPRPGPSMARRPRPMRRARSWTAAVPPRASDNAVRQGFAYELGRSVYRCGSYVRRITAVSGVVSCDRRRS
jgi:dipeptidase E